MARRLVKNKTTGSTAEFDNIRSFGDFVFPYINKDRHDNWFYQNLSNMTQEDYINCQDKDKLSFEYNDYIITKL